MTKEKTPQVEPKFIYVRDPGLKTVYANNTVFGFTAFDFSMMFGEIVSGNAESNELTAEQRVRVVMSPLHFKLFALTCMKQLDNYEQRFGEVKLGIDAEEDPATKS